MSIDRLENYINIVVVDDETLSRRLIGFILSEEGFNVLTANGAPGVKAALARYDVSLIIVNPVQPSLLTNGFVRQVQEQCEVPILFIVTKEMLGTMIERGLTEEYLLRPFQFAELLARIKIILRRSGRLDGASERLVVRAAGLKLDILDLILTLPNKKKVYLSPTEMKVLRCLMSQPGHVVSPEWISESVWGSGVCESSHIRVCISRVRRKLGQNNGKTVCIEAVRGDGYRLTVGV
ncbi:MAG: response regulator transcription factor [Chloroflexi bacterium]|nr:response regulator transcription factor [Chloroflexota bacterium]